MAYIIIYFLSVLCFVVNGNVTKTKRWQLEYLPRDCGKTLYETLRIIDGEVAELGQFPWIVRIGMMLGKTPSFFCGGSLINKYYVVTAAHCEATLGNIVRLGENYLTGPKDCNNGVCAPPHQDIKINKFVPHRDYCAATSVNDIALIELTRAAKFNDYVQPICIPNGPLESDDLRYDPAIIAGWGLVKARPEKWPRYLMYILAPVVDQEECDYLYSTVLEDTQLCMGYSRGKDSCGGDSGGPVSKVMRTDSGEMRAFLRGIVSYGLVSCGKGPAVYTDVSMFADWIENHVYKG